MNWAIRRTTTQALNTTTVHSPKSTTRTPTEPTPGFSLVELLVVVAILAILAAIAIPLFLNQRSKAAQGAAQSDARNLATNVNTLFTNLPRSADPNVALNGNTAPNATLSGSGTVAVGGETLNVNLSPDVTITKTGNADPAEGAGLKITHAGVENWACVVPLPSSVAYAQTITFQPACGTVVSEVGNLLLNDLATGTDLTKGTSVIGSSGYISWLTSSAEHVFSGERSIKITRVDTRPDAQVSGFTSRPGGSCCPVPPTITGVEGGKTYTLTGQFFAPDSSRRLDMYVKFFDDSNTLLGTTPGITAGDTSNSWQQLSGTFESPAGTTKASFLIRTYTNVDFEVFYADNIGLWEGNGGTWMPPGVPIVKP